MNPILCIDLETGGLKADYHAPVSLAAVLMDTPDNVVDSKEWIFQRMDNTEPKFKRRNYDVGALEVSGTTWKQIKEGTPERVVLQEFREFVTKHDASMLTVVSHNAVFDAGFMSDWMFRCGDFDRNVSAYVMPRCPIGGPWACTMRMAQVLLILPDYKLDTVAAHFGLSRSGETHGATEDCVLAGQVYAHLTRAKAEMK